MDLRIQKTYRSLLTAFTKLLEKHRYEDVSVAMLCEEAMIRRTTFYKHFADKSEFFSFFVDSLRIELVKYGEARAEELRLAKGESAEDDPLVVNVEEGTAILRALVDFLLEHAQLVDNILDSSMSGMMLLMIEDRVAEILRERYHAHSKARGEDPLAFASASEFAAGGIVRLFGKWWMRGHDPETEDDLVNTAETMVLRVLSR